MRVVYDSSKKRHNPTAAIDNSLGTQICGFESRGERYDFEYGSWLKRCDYRQVFPILHPLAGLQMLVQVVSRIVCKRQNFTALRVHRNQAPVIGVVLDRKSTRLNSSHS